MTTITQPNPGVSGETQPVTSFTYYSTGVGLLATMRDANLNSTNFTYNADSTLYQVTATGQPPLTYQSMTSASLPQGTACLLPVSTITATSLDQSNDLTTYKLDRFGDPTSVKDANYNTTTYQLNDNGQVTQMDQPSPGEFAAAPITTYTYNSQGDLVSENDPNGTTQSWSYESCSTPGGDFEQLTSYTDGLNNTTNYGLDPDGDVLSITQFPGNGAPAGVTSYVTSYTYTTVSSASGIPGGQVATMKDADGNTTTYSYAYSSSGMVETTTYAAGTSVAGTVTDDYNLAGDLLWEIDELDQATNYTYDNLDRLVSVIGPLDSNSQRPETDYRYDAMGDLLQQTQVVERSPLVTEVSNYYYNGLEQLITEYDPGPNGGLPVTTSYTYTPTGQLHTETDPNKNTTTYTYTALGQLHSVTTPSPTTAGPSVTTYTYDALGRLQTETDPEVETLTGGLTSPVTSALASPLTSYTYTYYENDLIVTTKLPTGATETDWYDADGNLVFSDDATGLAVNYYYDGMNRPAQVLVNGKLVGPTYDGVGNVVTDTDMEGNITNYYYNARNELKETVQPSPDGTAPRPTTQYGYDLDGNLTSETDTSGDVTSYAYDNLGRMISSTAPNPTTGQEAGSLLTTGYSYDLVGNLLTETDPIGYVTTYGYDQANNLTSMRLPNPTTGSATGGPLTSYVYDGDGNLLSLTDPDGNKTTWTYNAADLVSSETNPLNYVATSTYDPAGDLTQYVDADGRETDYNYNLLGEVSRETWKSSVGGAMTNQINYGYDADGRLDVAWDDSSTYAAALDQLGRPTTIAVNFAGMQTQGVGLSQTFNYDNQIKTLAVAVGTVTNAVVTIAKPPPMPYAAGTTPPAFQPSGSAPEAPVLPIGSGSVYYSDSSGQIHVLVYGATLDLENSYTYNADDQLNSITQGMAPASSFSSAPIGPAAGMTSYGANSVAPKTVTFGYDDDGRLSTMDLYDKGYSGSPSTMGTPTIQAAYGYDDASRLKNLTYTGPTSTVLAGYGLTYDNDSRVKTVTSAADAGTKYYSTSYTYDDDSQLTSTEYADSTSISQTFDSNGNRTAQTGPAPVPSEKPGADNQLLFDGTYHYAYDADGNRTARYRCTGTPPSNTQVPSGATDITTYTWDNRNRLTEVKYQAKVGGPVISEVQYSYNVFNQMISGSSD